jgi:3-isopropylmalate dehydrogenase
VDAFCVFALETPQRFDVVVTDNLFGDIVTDLGAVLQGGMGVAAGANLNPDGVSMFEPIGGSAPPWTGTGGINPIAAIAAMGMLLEHVGQTEAARRVDTGIRFAVSKMASQRAGEMGFFTSEVGDLVAEGASHG